MKFPDMHKELVGYLTALADAAYQEREWVPRTLSERTVTFDDIVHFIFDDTRLSRDAGDCIGEYLRNSNEAVHVRAVAAAIDTVLNTYGGSLTDAEYIAKPEWQDVLRTAKAALAAVSAPDDDTAAL